MPLILKARIQQYLRWRRVHRLGLLAASPCRTTANLPNHAMVLIPETTKNPNAIHHKPAQKLVVSKIPGRAPFPTPTLNDFPSYRPTVRSPANHPWKTNQPETNPDIKSTGINSNPFTFATISVLLEDSYFHILSLIDIHLSNV